MSMRWAGFLATEILLAACAPAALAAPAPATPAPAAEPQAVAVPAAVLAQYVGRYRITADLEALITFEDGRLYGALTGRPPHELFAASPTRFFARDADAEVSFELGPDGRATRLLLRVSGQDLQAVRVEAPAP